MTKREIANPSNKLRASLKCPFCEHIMEIEIPEDRCLVFWKCEKCQKLITTPKGECCVICAYSDKKCPVSMGQNNLPKK